MSMLSRSEGYESTCIPTVHLDRQMAAEGVGEEEHIGVDNLELMNATMVRIEET